MKFFRGKRKLAIALVMFVVVGLFATTYFVLKNKANADTAGNDQNITKAPESDFVYDELVIKFKTQSGSFSAEPTIKSSQFAKLGTYKKIFEGSTVSKISAATQNLDNYYVLKIDKSKISSATNNAQSSPSPTATASANNNKSDFEKEYSKREKENARANLLSLRQRLKSDPNIEDVSLNYIRKANWDPNDTYYRLGYSFGNSYDAMWGLKNISMSTAWDESKGAGVVVAVVDSGVDVNHEDLQANIYKDNNGNIIGKNFSSSPWQDPDDLTDHLGHGTHVAGTIAATGNNGIGVVGVAPESKIMPVRVLNDWGNGTDTDIAAGIKFAADNGANIINLSLGGPGEDPIFEDAVKYATDKNIVVVAAAGNDNVDTMSFSPANIPEVVTVAAFDPYKQKAEFSNYGPKIDISAPGVDILSTIPEDSNIAKWDPSKVVDGKYARIDGTSMATPHVAGLAALIISKNQGQQLDPQKIKNMLHNSTDISDPREPINDVYGFGTINASKATDISPATQFPEAKLNALTKLQKKNFNIKGTVLGSQSGDYQLTSRLIPSFPQYDYYPGYNGITSGTNAIVNGKLGNFTVTAQNDGLYYIKLISTNSAGYRSMDFEQVQLAKSQADGFPLENEYINPEIEPISTKLDNINQVTLATTYAGIDAYNSNNQKIWSYATRDNGDYYSGIIPTRPLICDTNGDSKKEVIAITPNPDANQSVWQKVVALDDRGQVLWSYYPNTEWADNFKAGTHDGVFLCEDFNNDGKDEVVLTERKQTGMFELAYLNLVILGNDGNPIKTITLEENKQSESVNGNATAGDINGDGNKELAISYSLYDRSSSSPLESHIKLFNSTFDTLWSKTYPSGETLIYSLEIGNFKKNNKRGLFYSLVKTIWETGSWTPKRITDFFVSSGEKPSKPLFTKTGNYSQSAVPMKNGQSINLFGSYKDLYGAVHHIQYSSENGSRIGKAYRDTNNNSVAELSVDTNNDNEEEMVIFNLLEGPRVVKNGTRIKKFYTGNYAPNGLISDLNSNGKVDLSVTSNTYDYGQFAIAGIYLFDFNSPYSLQATWPMSCHDYKKTCSVP